jgi:hypothetical protein
MIAEGYRDQAHTRRVGTGALGECHDALVGEGAHGKIVVACPAEPAEIGASTNHLDEEARAELGVRGEDGRGWWVHSLGRLECRFLDHRRSTCARPGHEGLDPVLGVVADVVKGGHIEPSLAHEAAQKVVSIRCLGKRLHERWHQRFAFPGRDHVGKGRERFGIDEGDGPPNHHERVVMCAGLGARRHASEPEEREHVRVVPFKRDRERKDVEVANRRLRLEGEQRRPGGELLSEFTLGRQEDALADDRVFGVEQLVHRLEAKVRHADEVRIGEGQGDAQAPPVGLDDIAHLLGQTLAGAFSLGPVAYRHTPTSLLPTSQERRDVKRRGLGLGLGLFDWVRASERQRQPAAEPGLGRSGGFAGIDSHCCRLGALC